MRRMLALALGTFMVAVPTRVAAGPGAGLPGLASAPGLFLNILPAGQGQSTTAADLAQYEATGQPPAHDIDQLAMYEDLPVASSITDANLTDFFKPESLGVTGAVERTENPRAGVTIERDSFGVPHIEGATRADVMWGAGYVLAEDRLFMADVLRHVGKGRLSEFLGPSDANIQMDRDMYLVAGYSDQELADQVAALQRQGAAGRQVLTDAQSYIDGVNARIQEDLTDPSIMPAEYPALQITPADWTPSDVVAVAALIQAVFAAGGGAELGNAAFLSGARAKLGATKGQALWRDMQESNDPEAPTSVDSPFPYMNTLLVSNAGVAMPDPGSVQPYDPITTSPGSSSQSAATQGFDPGAQLRHDLAAVGLDFPGAMSNWLSVTSQYSASGHPIAVMGPQVSYFSPEILMEEDLEGPGISARGAAFPGISLYVLLGRGPGFAWSATSGESDLVDVRAEKLCEPGGGQPTTSSTNYVYNGACVPMLTRTDQWVAKPTAGGPGPPEVVTANVERTVHGPVIATGTVGGQPVAFTRQRSTFFGEVDSATAFELLNSAASLDPTTFQQDISRVTGSFNWLYVDSQHVAYYHSGKYPIRASGVDPALPSWGTGQWEWRGFVSFGAHPNAVDPAKGWIDSWNNKPAPQWRAADDQWGYGSIHRVLMLSSRLGARVPAGGVHPSDMVSIMADAATVDLRGQEDLPVILQAIGSDPEQDRYLDILRAWVASGAHRIDRDGDGQYDDQAAVALMDAWWPRLIHAMFDGTLDGLYQDVLVPIDDPNRLAGLGSSFQGGYYGYVQKTIRMALGQQVAGRFSVLRCGNGTLASCRSALVGSLAQTIQALGSDPSTWDADEAGDQIRFQSIGLVNIDPIPWQNRPTFQQVVQVTGP